MCGKEVAILQSLWICRVEGIHLHRAQMSWNLPPVAPLRVPAQIGLVTFRAIWAGKNNIQHNIQVTYTNPPHPSPAPTSPTTSIHCQNISSRAGDRYRYVSLCSFAAATVPAEKHFAIGTCSEPLSTALRNPPYPSPCRLPSTHWGMQSHSIVEAWNRRGAPLLLFFPRSKLFVCSLTLISLLRLSLRAFFFLIVQGIYPKCGSVV